MSERNTQPSPTNHMDEAEPPGGGRQDHDVMQAAASYPVTGDRALGLVAASGGLELAGREPHPIVPAVHEEGSDIIPGERDATTLTHRESGAMGGRWNGADIPPAPIDVMLDAETIHDHEIEGGGDAVAHPRETHRKGNHA